MNARDFDPQDPLWTAYLLGELDAAERAEMDERLATSPAARQFFAELTESADLVATALTSEAAPKLAPEQRAAVLSAMDGPASSAPPSPSTDNTDRGWRHGMLVPSLSLAALLLLTFGLSRAVVLRPAGSTLMSDKQLARYVDKATQIEYPNPHAWDVSNDSDGIAPQSAPIASNFGEAAFGTKSKEIDFTVAKPVYESPKGDICYTVKKPTYQTPPQSGAKSYISGGNGMVGSGAAMSGGRGEMHRQGHSSSVASNAPGPLPSVNANNPIQQSLIGKSSPVDRFSFNGPITWTDRANEYQVNQFLTQRERQSNSASELGSGGGKGTGQAVNGQAARGKVDPALVETETLTTDSPQSALAAYDVRLLRQSEFRHDQPGAVDAEAYEPVVDNPFLAVPVNPLSTFSVDVDTASYSNLRRYLTQNRQLPPPSVVRIEEMINYFPYRYAGPTDNTPFAVHTEVAGCPWSPQHRLLRVGIKGREIARDQRPVSNLVFLLDVSGSMNEPNKLPLVKESMRMLVGQLSENDRVAIVVYAGASGLVLPSVTGDQKDTILSAIDRLSAGGSTNGAAGIELAYEIAAGHFIKGGTNRVILATDGDFNVGVTDRGALVQLVEEKAKHGVFLTALGFGMGNLKDATLEQLADKGNGNYAYIDGEREARKVFVEQMAGTLVTIAKDVKLQLEFNPAQVASYRLIGYENRALRNEDFNNDKKDAGDIGAGHTVTALYELTPTAAVPANATPAAVDALKYQRPASLAEAAQNGELLTLKLRYKQPDADQSQLIEHPVKDGGKIYAQASADFKFASAVALFGMLLRQSPYHGQASFDTVLELAKEAIAAGPSVAEQQRKEAAGVKEEVVGDANGYRGEFIQLVEIAKSLQPAAAK